MNTTQTKQEQKIELVKTRLKNVEYFVYKNLKFVKGINSKGFPVLAVWRGRQQNPFHNYFYRQLERVSLTIDKLKENEDLIQEQKAETKRIKAAFVPDIKVGDIYVASWGYEQTNVDSYQIIEKISKHYALLIPIANKMIPGSEGHDSCDVIPLKDSFIEKAEPFRVKIGMHGIKLNSYKIAFKWDGKREFYKSWYY